MTYLQYQYQKYNHLYFDRQLPPCVVKWEDLSKEKAIGRYHYDIIEGKTLARPRWHEVDQKHTISLDPSLKNKKSGCQKHLTLLHEMAHLAVRLRNRRCKSHGKIWQQEMLRLATVGAFKNLW